MGLEEEVALERGNALVHRRELVLLARAEGRALRRVIGVEREQRPDFRAGRPREVKVAHVVEELLIGSAAAEESEHQWCDSNASEGPIKRTAYVMFHAPEANIVPSSSESPVTNVK